MQRTLILVKPDAFARNLSGEIIARFERKALRLVALKLSVPSQATAAAHYAEHKERQRRAHGDQRLTGVLGLCAS